VDGGSTKEGNGDRDGSNHNQKPEERRLAVVTARSGLNKFLQGGGMAFVTLYTDAAAEI
jgi:hypothetical protein